MYLWDLNYIPVRHDMMRQTNDCLPVRVMQHKVKYFLLKPSVCVRVVPDPWAELQVYPALMPAALGLGQPGALPAGLVQPCPKPRALIHKPVLSMFSIPTNMVLKWVVYFSLIAFHVHVFNIPWKDYTRWVEFYEALSALIS